MFDVLTNRPVVQALLRNLPVFAEAFAVGGAVRDAVLDRPVGDLDVVVRHVPLAELRTVLEKLGHVDAKGEQWGVLAMTVGDAHVDVALPREDMVKKNNGGYFDTVAKPDPELPIVTDLKRRDFTVNTLALNLRTNELVDPFHAMLDLRQKVLRTIGNPTARFSEDHTRILRCLRFATQLGFTIEPLTWEALKTVVQGKAPLHIPLRVWKQELQKASADLPAYHEWLRKAGIETHHADA